MPDPPQLPPTSSPPSPPKYNGGIEDDIQETVHEDDGGLQKTHDSLARDGVAGGSQMACCHAKRLLDKLDTRVKYTLVVIGNIFLDKGHAAQIRMSRELAGALTETLKAPVVGPEELKKNLHVQFWAVG